MVWFLMLIYVRKVTFHSYRLFRVKANSPLFGNMPLLTLPTTLFKQKQSLVPQITTYQNPKGNVAVAPASVSCSFGLDSDSNA
jgi:hypothetical protein